VFASRAILSIWCSSCSVACVFLAVYLYFLLLGLCPLSCIVHVGLRNTHFLHLVLLPYFLSRLQELWRSCTPVHTPIHSTISTLISYYAGLPAFPTYIHTPIHCTIFTLFCCRAYPLICPFVLHFLIPRTIITLLLYPSLAIHRSHGLR
jgi:hypothetical protein